MRYGKLYICIIVCAICCFLLQGVSFFGFREAIKQKENKEKESAITVLEQENKEFLAPGAYCRYLIQNPENGEEIIKEETLASAFVGWKRKELENYIKEYNQIEKQKHNGNITLELVEFSEKGIVVRKRVNDRGQNYKFIVVVESGQVVVYDAKWENKYEDTNIMAKNLSVEEQIKLSKGIKVKDEKELYAMLENYSS